MICTVKTTVFSDSHRNWCSTEGFTGTWSGGLAGRLILPSTVVKLSRFIPLLSSALRFGIIYGLINARPKERRGNSELTTQSQSCNCGNCAMSGFKLPGSRVCASVFSVFWERHCQRLQNQNVSVAGKEEMEKAKGWGARGRKGSKTGRVPKSRLSWRVPPLETRGIWATSSRNCLFPTTCLGLITCHHFHLMKDCCCALYSMTVGQITPSSWQTLQVAQ